MTKKVILIAPVLTQSGYGVHSRQVAQYLFKLMDEGADFTLDIWPISCGQSPYYLNKSNPLIARIYKHSERKNLEYDVSIQIQMPSPKEWNPNIAKVNIGITAGVETDLCNLDWIKTINAMTHVIMPSEYSKSTFVKSAEKYNYQLTTPISVVREFVSESYFEKSQEEDIFKDIKTSFNFFIFGQITGLDKDTDRKNLFLAIQTLFAAFHNNNDVGIIVKSNVGRETDIDNFHVSTILSQIKESTCDFTNGQGVQPKLYNLHGAMSEAELRRVYQSPKVKALYTTTRGEAVGLPIVEAAASGLPIIAPDKGGHTEYLEAKKWISLKSEYAPIAQSKIDNDIFVNGARWIDVEPREAVATLQKFYKNNVKPKEWAKSQSEIIKKKFSAEEVFKQYDDVLKQYLV